MDMFKPASKGLSLFSASYAFTLVVSITISSGCGRGEPTRAAVSGSVTYQGKPVEFGDVIFQPTEGDWRRFYAQAPVRDGKYQLQSPGAIVGLNRVEIHGYRQTGRQVLDVAGKRPDEPVEPTPETVPYIPLEFNAGSTLTIEIKPGSNENVNFDL